VKAVLLEGYEKETLAVVRNKLCDAIADIARHDEEEDRLSLSLNLAYFF
jgi:hypothetical protein